MKSVCPCTTESKEHFTSTLEKIDWFGSKAIELMGEHHIPGISIGLIVDGTEHYIPLGATSVLRPLEVTPEALFQIASVTKTFTASAAMRLVEMGKLELDVTVRRHIPNFKLRDKSVAARVTIRYLLTHTSGLMGDFDIEVRTRDFLDLKKPEPQAIPTTADQLEEFVAWYVLPTGNPEAGIEISLEQDLLHVRVNIPFFQ